MNIFFVTLFVLLTTLTSYASDIKNTSICTINKCKSAPIRPLSPTIHIIPIYRYRLNIKIDESYKHADVYLNKDKLPKGTGKDGALTYTIPSRDEGMQCLKIKKAGLIRTFQFLLNSPRTIVCKGKKGFSCSILDGG